MTKNTNRFKSITKQVAALGIIACTFWLAGETRVIAQEKEILVDLDVKASPGLAVSNYPEHKVDLNVRMANQDTIKPKSIVGRSQMVQKRLVRYKDKDGQLIEKKYAELSPVQKERFKEKSAEAQFFLPPPPKAIMDQALLDDFLDAKKYGVWIDGKRVSNEKIASYQPTDFHHYFKSALLKNAKDYGKYTFHLSLTTNEYFESNPNYKGKWIDFSTPTIIEIPEQNASKNKENNQPQVKEIKVKTAEDKHLDQPKVKEIKVKATKPKVKEKPQVKEKMQDDNDKVKDFKVKKGQFNPQLHSPGLDLEKVEYFLAPTFSAHLKYISSSGTPVIKTYGEMTDKEYSMWVNPKNNGQIFNPPKAINKITFSELDALKQNKDITFRIDGKLASSSATSELDYMEVYDWKLDENEVNITSHYVFLEDETAWRSRIQFKKAED